MPRRPPGGPLRRGRALERARAPRGPRVEFLRRLVASAHAAGLLIRVPVLARDWTVPLRPELGLPTTSATRTTRSSTTRQSFRAELAEAGLRRDRAAARLGRDLGGGGAGDEGLGARRAGRWGRAGVALGAAARGRCGPTRALRVFYGHDRVPGAGRGRRRRHREVPAARRALAEPRRPTSRCSTSARPALPARRSGRSSGSRGGAARRSCVNQNGVGYPGWAGDRVEELNRPLRRALAAADHVLYQSAFCKRSADEFLGEPRGEWEILHNAVDVGRFTPGGAARRAARAPARRRPDAGLPARARAATLARAAGRRTPDARLLVTGRLVSGRRARSEARRARRARTRSARRRTSSAARTCSCTRR